MSAQRLLITGANGFVGRVLTRRLLDAGYTVRGTLLSGESSESLTPGVLPTVVAPLGPDTFWQQALQGLDTVIHLAARVHVMDENAADPLQLFREINTAGTECLAREAARAGVRRLVFVSTIKVNGEESSTPYNEKSPFNPQEPYATSKMEAEVALRRVEEETGLELVIVRPPLVYGPWVKANFLKMLQTIKRGVPLPLASVQNRRSFIFVGNLADVLSLCAIHPKAAGRTFPVSDGEDLSTAQLVRHCADLLGIQPRLFPCPVVLLRHAGRITGKGAAVERLVGSLSIDSSAIRNELGWQPPFTISEGLQETVEWFRDSKL